MAAVGSCIYAARKAPTMPSGGKKATVIPWQHITSPYDPHLVLPGDFDTDCAQNAIRHLIQQRHMRLMPSSAAMIALPWVCWPLLREAGIRVPEEVSVVGFDDVDFASHVHPPLTTVHAPTEQVGEQAVEQLLKLIEGETVEPVTLLPVETRHP